MEDYLKQEYLIKDEVYSILKDNIICPICYNLKLNPMICLSCQNSICGLCSKELKICPMERKEIKWVKGKLDEALLSKINFKCKDCCQIMPYSKLIFHWKEHNKNINQNDILYKENILLKNEIKQLKLEEKKLKYENEKLQKGQLKFQIKNYEKHFKSIFHNHPLIKGINTVAVRCKICIQPCLPGTTFCCELCQYDLCETCQKLEELYKKISTKCTKHEHLLIYGNNEKICKCDNCNNLIYEKCSYRCNLCDFDICQKCFMEDIFYCD